MHKSHMCRSTLLANCWLPWAQNQQDDRSGPNEETETCNADESVDHVLHSVVDNEDNHQHKAG